MRFTLASVVLGLSISASCTHLSLSPRLHEHRRAAPSGWVPVRRAEPTASLPIRIGLAQSNLANLDSYLLSVSDPASPSYGQHWSAAKIAETFRPSTDAVDAVRTWLLANGVPGHAIKLASGGAWMHADVAVADAERLLGTQYHVYQHSDGTEQVACADKYHLPEHLRAHVELVLPTLNFDVDRRAAKARRSVVSAVAPRDARSPSFSPSFPVPRSEAQQPDPSSVEHCGSVITPACVRALYGFDYNFTTPSNNSIGIVEYSPEVYLPKDLDMFFQNFSSSLVGTRPNLISIDGGQNNVTIGAYLGEADLDLQYAMALVGESQTVNLYQTGDGLHYASYNNFLDALDGSYCTYEGGDDPAHDAVFPDPQGGYQGPESCGTAPLSHVISTSYTYDEEAFTPAYMQRQCNEYAKLGLMGVTFLFSSGDFGVAGYDNECLISNGTLAKGGSKFVPTWPSTCPYVTSIGATQLPAGGSVNDKEVACQTLISSSGGFSNVFALPDYQKSAVQTFLKNYPPSYPSAVWNATGLSRGFPDLSANGANYSVADNGTWTKLSGTSASTPVIAAMLAAVNDARAAAGKNPVGFINPTIYSASFADAFHDITGGTNPGCGTAGFSAQPGWDPVTGLGTPNFPKLLELWKALP
ncbi:peptidase S8/S53 domain-containing protein [Amylocystis lapponica]|nr:peptidase S8/S53 domain-containing protein [Amylocystis lapponica]